jgi:hypothetical protein
LQNRFTSGEFKIYLVVKNLKHIENHDDKTAFGLANSQKDKNSRTLMKITAQTWINAICVWSIQWSQYGQILHHHVADK